MKFTKQIMSSLLGAIAASLLASSVHAAPITVPVGLNPGDTYRLAFRTSNITPAISTDINFYNNFVNGLGVAATGISGWKAIASTASVDAIDNTNTSGAGGAPIYLLDGTTKIADNNADLWDGMINARINIDEFGNFENLLVWTGTGTDGLATATPLGSDGPATFGDYLLFSLGGGWINDTSVMFKSTFSFNLYAISETLTVQASEPGAFALFALGLAGLGFARRKRAASTTV